MASWNRLPNEIKHMIMNEVAAGKDRSDLCRFRLVARECESMGQKRFAKRNFTYRRHSIRQDSLEALVEINKHPVFSSYLNTVLLSAIENYYFDTEVSTFHLTFDIGEPKVLTPLLRQAFINLKAIGTPMTIGLTRKWGSYPGARNLETYAWNPKFAHRKGVNDQGYLMDTTWAHIAENERVVFEMLTSVADEIELPVKRLKVKLLDHYEHPTGRLAKERCSPELVDNIFSYLERHPSLAVDIRCTFREWQTPQESINVQYSKRAGRLTMTETEVRNVYRLMQLWLSSIELKEVKLIKMEIERSDNLRTLVRRRTTTLKSLRMDRCKTLNAGKLRKILRLLSTMPALENHWIHKPIVQKKQEDSWTNFRFGNIERNKLLYKGDVQQHLLEQMRIGEGRLAGQSSEPS